jgi:hypothetical protein
VLHLGGRHHFDLLDHPQVYVHLREWISTTLAERPVTSAAARPPEPRG